MGSSQSAPPGDKMRAVIRGGKPDMAYNAAYAAPPAPGKNEVRLRVRAAGINPVDYKVSKMILGPVVGLDVSGVVEGVGEGVTTLAVGDEVYGTAKGSLADYVVAKASSLARKPAHLSFPEAAAMPTAYLTALQGLRDYGKLPQGGRVLIIGASGGCGQAAVQLAKHALQAGFIAGVCSSRNADTVRGLGAHRVVDYTTETLAGVFGELPDEEKFDVVFDAATNSGGGEAYKEQCLPLLRPASKDKGEPHGQYVAINGAVGMWLRKVRLRLGAKALRSGLPHRQRRHLHKAVPPLLDHPTTVIVHTLPVSLHTMLVSPGCASQVWSPNWLL